MYTFMYFAAYDYNSFISLDRNKSLSSYIERG